MSETVKVAVRVTAEHIAAGKREKCTDCPVALALAEQIPGGVTWWVYGPEMYGGPDERLFEVPDSVCDFVGQFDETGQGVPFTFELEVPKEWLAP